MGFFGRYTNINDFIFSAHYIYRYIKVFKYYIKYQRISKISKFIVKIGIYALIILEIFEKGGKNNSGVPRQFLWEGGDIKIL